MEENRIDSDAYTSILSREYSERIPCRVLSVEKSEIKDTLKKEEKILNVKRVPRILHSSFLSNKKGIEIETEKKNEKDTVWILLKEESSRGDRAVLVLSYEYFTHNELLKKAGISEDEYQSSYNKVGNIIHLNLKDDSVKHKEIISQVLLDKIKDCKTVIRKCSNINNTFRNIEIEHLAGKRAYKTVHKENGLRFSIDYDKVYWNSKLQKERENLSGKISKNETVCDLFCGVGPFSILALAKGATVWANDLNPDSIKNFKESIVLNRKVLGVESESVVWNEELEDRIFLYNLDAHDFLIKSAEEKKRKTNSKIFNHYILNLPELTLSFIKYFVKIEEDVKEETKATVHAYFFIKTGESAVEKIEAEMNRKVICTSRLVRKVSPCKEMWLVSFELLKNN
ncbi:tRNA (guanine37-N1)-methyltransferase [Nematocida minor]|uniref:tRNA (guanine37-N1)-methyltransferase n=1 Tax=Nematocida minor TaxID=1912983 RepID=UPI00221E504E|nr:tRNA (guanine37-N1)-methyltransferase [Nematocida minor]KAI5193226.1 tRNA (guanine37-N1)-methyltransferase [Nematocida minor]